MMFKRKKAKQAQTGRLSDLLFQIGWDRTHGWVGHVYIYTGRSEYNEGWELWALYAERHHDWIKFPSTCVIGSSQKAVEARACEIMSKAYEYMNNPIIAPRSIINWEDCQ